MIRTLARADKGGGVKLHLFPNAVGFQANVSATKDNGGWAVETKRSSLDAMEAALSSMVKAMRLEE